MAEEASIDGTGLVLDWRERESGKCLCLIQETDPGEEEGEAAESNLAS
jgi:hypothetical protein